MIEKIKENKDIYDQLPENYVSFRPRGWYSIYQRKKLHEDILNKKNIIIDSDENIEKWKNTK